jgi:O-antigen/teichoic acid export membrane protein
MQPEACDNSMSSIGKTTSNLLNVIGGEMLLRFANVAVAILIGRVYGATLLGTYASVIAVATVAERLADNGLEMAGIAEASKNPADVGRLATALYVNKTALSIVAIFLLAGLGAIAGLSGASWMVAGTLTLRTFLYSYCRLHAGLLKAFYKTVELARIQSVHCGLLLGGVLLAYLRSQSFTTLLLYLLGAQSFEYILSLRVLRSSGVRARKVSPQFCWSLLHRSTPVGLTYSLSTLMLRGDVLVLSLLASASVVGIFVAADTGLVMVYVVAGLFSGVLLADLGRLARDRDEFELHFRKCIVGICGVTFPLAVAAIFVVPQAIRLVFGGNFALAGLPGAVMAVAIPFIILNAAYLSRAIARNAARACLAIYGAAAILSVGLNFLFGNWYGAKGIAAAIVIREAAITLAFCWVGDFPGSSERSTVAVQGNAELGDLLNA